MDEDPNPRPKNARRCDEAPSSHRGREATP